MKSDEALSAAAALAALSACESLMIALMEKGLLERAEFEEIIESARLTHLHAEPAAFKSSDHMQAAEILRRIQSGANSLRGSGHL